MGRPNMFEDPDREFGREHPLRRMKLQGQSKLPEHSFSLSDDNEPRR